MDTRADPHIINCDRMGSGVVVSFDDGMSAFYSAALLYAMLHQARAMPSEAEAGWLPFST
jgi:hypothetical protein